MAQRSKSVELIIYTSTSWIWIRREACTEVVKPFKCFLHTSACFSYNAMEDWMRQYNICLWKCHEPPLYLLFIFCSLSENKITDELLCALVRELQVNQSHQKLEWVQPFISNFLRGGCWDYSVIPMHVHWNMREDLHAWWHLQTLSYTFGTIYMHLYIPDLWSQSSKSSLFVTNNSMHIYQSTMNH